MDFRDITEFIKDTSKYIVVIILVLLFFIFVVGLNQVIGPSMEPNLYEDDIVKVFLDVNPNSTGHCLIVPKEHYQDFFDIDKEVLNHVLETAKVIANRLKERLNCDGITFAQNNGLGQDVKHYHLHLIPKYHNDDKLSIEEVYNKLK